QFTSEALYKLLKKASPGMLYTDGGDGMDKLFIPAFKNTTDIKLQEKLLNVFLEYENKARGYYGKNYFDRLLQQINDVASAELQNLILRKKEDNKEPQDQSILLENINENNFPDVIDKMVNQTAESFNRSNFNKITFAAR